MVRDYNSIIHIVFRESIKQLIQVSFNLDRLRAVFFLNSLVLLTISRNNKLYTGNYFFTFDNIFRKKPLRES
jgi:hypothetical protein